MAKTKRAQVLMEPVEYQHLEALAKRADRSVADLVREAVREKYFVGTADKREVAGRILSLNVPIDTEWSALEREIEKRADDV